MSIDGYGNTYQPGLVTEPVLRVGIEVWGALLAYVGACPVEVNGFGYIERTGPADFVLSDVFILEQTVTAGSAENDDTVVARHLTNMVRQGMDTGLMRFQWHSHVNGGARFSTTDINNIEHAPGDWLVSLVANKRGEFEVRLDIMKPFRFWWPVRVAIDYVPSPEQYTAAQADITALVHQTGFFRRGHVKPEPTAMLTSIPGELTAVNQNGDKP